MTADGAEFEFEIYFPEGLAEVDGELEAYGPMDAVRRLIRSSKTADEIQALWKPFLDNLQRILDSVSALKPQNVVMDSVEVSLQVTAKGGLAFIAEAGLQGNVKVIFKRTA